MTTPQQRAFARAPVRSLAGWLAGEQTHRARPSPISKPFSQSQRAKRASESAHVCSSEVAGRRRRRNSRLAAARVARGVGAPARARTSRPLSVHRLRSPNERHERQSGISHRWRRRRRRRRRHKQAHTRMRTRPSVRPGAPPAVGVPLALRRGNSIQKPPHARTRRRFPIEKHSHCRCSSSSSHGHRRQ